MEDQSVCLSVWSNDRCIVRASAHESGGAIQAATAIRLEVILWCHLQATSLIRCLVMLLSASINFCQKSQARPSVYLFRHPPLRLPWQPFLFRPIPLLPPQSPHFFVCMFNFLSFAVAMMGLFPTTAHTEPACFRERVTSANEWRVS